MSKKLISLTPLIIVLGLVGNVTVVRATDWTGAVSSDWYNAANWTGVVPTSSERTLIQSLSPLTWPIINGGTANTAQLRMGYDAPQHGELSVTGGATLNVNGELRLGRKISGTDQTVGTLHVSGETTTINVTQRIACGRHGAGIINMSGGYLHCDAELRLSYRDDGSGTVYLSGGTIDLGGNPGITVFAGDNVPGYALIDISGDGKLTLAGNQVSTIETLVSDGIILAGGGEGTVSVTYDGLTTTLVATGLVSETASKPNPADEATDVPRDVVLSWTPGEYAPPVNGHKVYFSESFNDVNDGIGGVAQDANSYAPGRLDLGMTYYWRIDEVNAPPDSTIFEGEIWQFTTEPIGYAIGNITATASSAHAADMGPENTINGSGMDANDLHSMEPSDMWLSGNEPLGAWIEYEFDKVYKLHEMWVWNSNQAVETLVGFGLKGATIEHSTNGTDFTILGTTHEFAQAPGAADYARNTTVNFGGAVAKYVKITANSNWGMLPQYGLSEVRFFYIPVHAREPIPDSGATDVDVDVTLGFRAGREAAGHDVYLSTDEQAVMDGTAPVATVTEARHGPLSLDLGGTYYWRVDEVNMAETPSMLEGDLWNFTTREFLVVDDFESYNDLDPTDPESNRIFNTWIDGFLVPANGSLVGYDAAPFAEQIIVHSDEQAMPLFYNSTGGAAYSEAELPLSPSQDWTKAGVATLVMYFQGAEGNTGQLYMKINGSKVVYDGDAADIATLRWKQWNIDLVSLGLNLQNVTKLAIGIDGNGASGTLYVDDIRLYRLAPEIPLELWLEAESADIMGASWRIYDDPSSSGGRHIGSESGDGNDNDTAPGAEWIAIYNFTAPAGVYKVLFRGQEAGSDSFWVRIPGATNLTPGEDPDQPGTGWVRFNEMDAPDGWNWDEVHSNDHSNAVVNWTLPDGAHTLEIGKREEGVLLDAIVISKVD